MKKKKVNIYNPENLKRGKKFDVLAKKTGKKKHTIQVYFCRNGMNVLNTADVRKYLKKFNK